MQMKASELPYDVKKKLLRQIEDQVGYSQYHEMVDRVGEDGLIELAFQQMEEMSASQAKKQRTRGQKIWLGIKIGFGVIILVIWLVVSPDTLGNSCSGSGVSTRSYGCGKPSQSGGAKT